MEKLKHMLWGAVIFLCLQMLYLGALQVTKVVSWEAAQFIGDFLVFYILSCWGISSLIIMFVWLVAVEVRDSFQSRAARRRAQSVTH